MTIILFGTTQGHTSNAVWHLLSGVLQPEKLENQIHLSLQKMLYSLYMPFTCKEGIFYNG